MCPLYWARTHSGHVASAGQRVACPALSGRGRRQSPGRHHVGAATLRRPGCPAGVGGCASWRRAATYQFARSSTRPEVALELEDDRMHLAAYIRVSTRQEADADRVGMPRQRHDIIVRRPRRRRARAGGGVRRGRLRHDRARPASLVPRAACQLEDGGAGGVVQADLKWCPPEWSPLSCAAGRRYWTQCLASRRSVGKLRHRSSRASHAALPTRGGGVLGLAQPMGRVAVKVLRRSTLESAAR